MFSKNIIRLLINSAQLWIFFWVCFSIALSSKAFADLTGAERRIIDWVRAHAYVHDIEPSTSDEQILKSIGLRLYALKERIPEEIKELSNLESVVITDSPLLDSEALGALASLKNLKNLNLRNNGIQAIPSFIFSLNQLKSLDLTDNAIQSLPDELIQLSNLSSFEFSNDLLHLNPPSEKVYEFFRKKKFMDKLCFRSLGKDRFEGCSCFNGRLIDPMIDSCKNDFINALKPLIQVTTEPRVFYRWGGPWGKTLVEEQKYDPKTINSGGSAAAGEGLYMAETAWVSTSFFKAKGTLVEVHVPAGISFIAEENFKTLNSTYGFYRVATILGPDFPLVQYDSWAGFWVVKDQTGLSYRLFDGSGHDKETLTRIYKELQNKGYHSKFGPMEILLRQVREGQCEAAKDLYLQLSP